MKKSIFIMALFIASFCDVNGQCETFMDNEDSEYLMQSYVLFKDYIRLEKFDLAYVEWKKVYDKAPAADGKRDHVYSNGQLLIEYQFNRAILNADKVKWKLFYSKLIEEQLECYPNSIVRELPKAMEFTIIH